MNQRSTSGASHNSHAMKAIALPAITVALAITAVFTGVLLGTIDYPLHTHADETAKVGAILKRLNPSYHPVLMLQIVRAARAWTSASGSFAVAEIGRACAVILGGLAVFASFLLGREVLPKLPALAATLAVAVAPLMTVHARYFKEDIFMLPFLLLALVALIEALRAPTASRGVLLGAAIGLAAGAKYIAAIMLPYAVVVLVFGACFQDRGARLRLVAIVIGVAMAVFLLVELPVFWELTQFRRAFRFELSHAANGHDVRLPISLTYGIFHLRESLLPGLGLPLVALGILGLTTPLWANPERRQSLLVIAAFALMWYVLHELSPLKPFPGFARYALPLAPLLIILGAAFIFELIDRYFPSAAGLVSAAMIVIAATPALHQSRLINGPNADDLRSAVPPLLADLQPTTYFDRYTQFRGLKGNAATANLFVTSSFRYERFLRFGAKPDQRGYVRCAADFYNALFELPYLEVTNGRPSFGFFNPVLRIVALDTDADHLETIAAILSRGGPDGLQLRLVNGEKRERLRQLICPYEGWRLPWL